MSYKRLSILAAASAGAMALAGCNTVNSHIGDTDPFMGEAVKYNAAVQTIDPAPVYPPDGAQAGDNGDVGARAVKRYRNGQVKQVETMTTTAGTGSSGGSTR